MSNIFLTSDLHLSHIKSFLWEPRGFTSVEEMNEKIVQNWNSVVKENDIVYNLGDMCLSDTEGALPYLARLNGTQIWIRGNHDTDNRITLVTKACPYIHLLGGLDASYATILKSGKWHFYLSHYPTLTANREDWRKVYNLCGHSHTQDRWADWDKRCYHVEMDAHKCFPVNLEEIKSDIRKKRELDARND